MSVVYYNFTNATTLGNFVSGPNGMGGWTAATNHLPAAINVMYVIGNIATNNCYVGIAANLNNRFGGRHEAAVHLGFDRNTMNQILVWWGVAQVYDTPVPAGPFAPPPAVPPVLPLNGAAPVPAVQIGAPSALFHAANLTATIDGQAGVNIEPLLIRYYLTSGVFTYNTNTTLVGPFANTTGAQINVYVNYCAIPPHVVAGSGWTTVPAAGAL